VTASFIVCQLQTIISREINPLDAGVITVGKITSGSASNIIPEIAIIEGTVRSLDSATRSYLHESIARMAECVAKAHRCSVGTEFLNGYPPTVNSAPFVKRAIVIAEELVDKQNMLEVAPTMGAEDMGYFLEKVPGCFFFLGIGGEHPHHSPRFDIDENMLHTGSAFLAGVAWDFLQDTSLYGV
jgi:amidohydrolase